MFTSVNSTQQARVKQPSRCDAICQRIPKGQERKYCLGVSFIFLLRKDNFSMMMILALSPFIGGK